MGHAPTATDHRSFRTRVSPDMLKRPPSPPDHTSRNRTAKSPTTCENSSTTAKPRETVPNLAGLLRYPVHDLIIRHDEAKPLVAGCLDHRSTVVERLRVPSTPDDPITFTCALEARREAVYFLAWAAPP